MELYKGTDANRTHERFSAVATSGSGAHSHSISMSEVGNNTPHNNMQPYTSCYIWRRTEQHAVGELASHTHTASSTTTSHNHSIVSSRRGNFGAWGETGGRAIDGNGSNPDYNNNRTNTSSSSHSHTISVNNAGGNTHHNNIQPYISCHIWKRTA